MINQFLRAIVIQTKFDSSSVEFRPTVASRDGIEAMSEPWGCPPSLLQIWGAQSPAIRPAVGAVRSGFDPFQPEPEHAPQVWFTLWHEPAPEPLGSGSPGLVRQVRVHGTEFQ